MVLLCAIIRQNVIPIWAKRVRSGLQTYIWEQ